MTLLVILLGFLEFFVIFVVLERRTSLKLNHQKLLREWVKHVRKKKGRGLKRFLSRSRRRFLRSGRPRSLTIDFMELWVMVFIKM